MKTTIIKEAESRADALTDLTCKSMSNSFVVYNKDLLDNFVDGLGNLDIVEAALVVDSSDDRILAHNNHSMDGRLASELSFEMQNKINRNDKNAAGSVKNELLYIKSADITVDGKKYAGLHIIFTFDNVHEKMSAFKLNLLFVSLIAVIAGIAFALLAAKKNRNTGKKIWPGRPNLQEKGDFNHILTYEGSDDLGKMADAFNGMLDKIKVKQKQLTAINRISDIVYSSLDINTVAESAVHAMMSYSKSPLVAFFLLSKDKEQLEMLYAEGFDEETLKKSAVLPIEGSLTGRAVMEKQVVTSADLTSDNRLEPNVRGQSYSLLSSEKIKLVNPASWKMTIFWTYFPYSQKA